MAELPKKDNKRMVTVELAHDLLLEMEREVKIEGITKRSAIEYGVRRWIEDARKERKKSK